MTAALDFMNAVEAKQRRHEQAAKDKRNGNG